MKGDREFIQVGPILHSKEGTGGLEEVRTTMQFSGW